MNGCLTYLFHYQSIKIFTNFFLFFVFLSSSRLLMTFLAFIFSLCVKYSLICKCFWFYSDIINFVFFFFCRTGSEITINIRDWLHQKSDKRTFSLCQEMAMFWIASHCQSCLGTSISYSSYGSFKSSSSRRWDDIYSNNVLIELIYLLNADVNSLFFTLS